MRKSLRKQSGESTVSAMAKSSTITEGAVQSPIIFGKKPGPYRSDGRSHLQQKKQRKSRREMWQAVGMALLGGSAMPAQAPGNWTPKKQSAGGRFVRATFCFSAALAAGIPTNDPNRAM